VQLKHIEMEIVAPAGNFEKLQYALAYNADAVYLAGHDYGLRAFAGNFSRKELSEAVKYAHAAVKRVYLTINIFALNEDISALPEYLQEIRSIPFDAVIVSEPGTLTSVKKHTDFNLHLSTQANTTNYEAIRFWQDQGVKRVILARELGYREILHIREEVPDMELEVFIHGAMCMAWSGRCLMSALLNERSANKGECTHPCRWKWNLTEPTRPGQVFSVEEDERGSYILHSKDLCLLREIPLLKSAGIAAGKIEGRMKSTYYAALMSRIYKEAALLNDVSGQTWQDLAQEAGKINHRPYFKGFFYKGDEDKKNNNGATCHSQDNSAEWQYCGRTTSMKDGLLWFDCLAKIESGDTVEVIFPERHLDETIQVQEIYDEDLNQVSFTKPNRKYALRSETIDAKWGLIRKPVHI
jgi:putative protease